MTNGQPLLKEPEALPSPWSRVTLTAVLAVLITSVLLVAFAWPAVNVAPRDVPLAVAGPAAGVAQIEEALERSQPGAFDVVALPDRDAAISSIRDRETYGAVIVDAQGPPAVLTASAASPLVAQLLGQAAQALSARQGDGSTAGVVVEDVAPLPTGDPRGTGLGAGILPLALGGLITGIVTALGVRGAGRRLATATLASVLVAPAVVGILHGWLEALAGDIRAEMGAVALGFAAISLLVVGLTAVAGVRGVPMAALIVVLLGNPLSGATSAPELLPSGWGALGQLLPPGAMVSLLRGISGFGGAGTSGPIVVLASWAVIGLLLVALGIAVAGRRRTADAH